MIRRLCARFNGGGRRRAADRCRQLELEVEALTGMAVTATVAACQDRMYLELATAQLAADRAELHRLRRERAAERAETARLRCLARDVMPRIVVAVQRLDRDYIPRPTDLPALRP